jgi:hypothetical protein
MPKTCVQTVGGHSKSVGTRADLSTLYSTCWIAEWRNQAVIPRFIHNFCIQLCTPKLADITEVGDEISPLSTALIMNTKWLTKENLLIGSGG